MGEARKKVAEIFELKKGFKVPGGGLFWRSKVDLVCRVSEKDRRRG